MADKTLIIRGVRDDAGEAVDLGPLADAFDTPPTYQDGVHVQPAGRGERVEDQAFEVDADDVVEIRYADGTLRYMSAARLAADFAEDGSRAGAADRVSLARLSGTSARGAVKHTVLALKKVGIDLPEVAGEKFADFVATRIEGRLGRPPGFYRVAYGAPDPDSDIAPRLEPAATPDDLPTGRPLLVFLHGTGSQFMGSFGALWSLTKKERKDASAARWGRARIAAWHEFVVKTYGPHVYTLEHPTLSASPMANALALLSSLPPNAALHLVSHSRGGLVGELIARATPDPDHPGDGEPFTAAELARFDRRERTAERAELEALTLALKAKRPRVTRFLRVACPARGTTLADGKLDDWLSGFASLVERFTPLGESDLFFVLKAVLLATVKQKANPEALPGLEAMMTTSPVIGLINGGPRLDADLSIIAGDTDAEGWIPWMWPVDTFFESEHFPEGRNDLVVPTRSMDLGYRRRAGQARRFEDRGGDVNHFSYFANRSTFERLVAGLERDDDAVVGFAPVARAITPAAPARTAVKRGPRPRLLLIPGISGSHIRILQDRIWLEIHEILFGNLVDLDVHGKGDPKAPGTGPDGIIARFYGDLAHFLDASHEVIQFGYDWRVSLADSAKLLDAWVTSALDDPKHAGQPVRILAHSMGGLVTRAWVDRHAPTWDRMRSHPDARILMLGTPNRGSYSIPQLLLGQDALSKQLALADPFHDLRDLLDLFRRFPGILALLPQPEQGGFDFTQLDTWKSLPGAGKTWPLPEKSDLDSLAADWACLADDRSIDAGRMMYVAGKADDTPVGMQIDGDGVQFLSTTRGDGRVPWDTGIPAPLAHAKRVWWLPAVHGDLCCHAPAFGAIHELLEHGDTSRLARSEPAARGDRKPFKTPPAKVVVFPDETSIVDAALGSAGAADRIPDRSVDDTIVRVQVTHGDLHHESGRPIVVGHYMGDPLVSAEAALDRKLGGALSEVRALGIYPGAIGQTEIVLHDTTGAIVVGLGQVGQLAPLTLKRTLRDGLLRYARARIEREARTRHEDAPAPLAPIGLEVAFLLVGTGTGGVNVSEAIETALEAVAAANLSLWRQDVAARIVDVDFLELYEDLAITAAHVLQNFASAARWQHGFAFDVQVVSGIGGWRRGNFDESPGWWRRLKVVCDEHGYLIYTAPTDRARVEESAQPTQRALLDRFVDDATRLTARDKELEQSLFELLLPNVLKEHAADESPLLLMLDEATARYPWEMLNDLHARGIGAEADLPLAARQGVIRQLIVDVFRSRPASETQAIALVIGDPGSKFPELPGAQDEARAVGERLKRDGYEVTSLVDHEATPSSVIKNLFARSYRVLHLAGHGVFRYERPQADEVEPEIVTGMVLGDDVFLTATEVEQMRVVPEFVFINCCSLGRITGDPRRERPELFAGRSRIAANLATQFIRMGAKAVVAAGWEVDDDAASGFAETFYDRLLAGSTFGAAALDARRWVYQNHGNTNTWGAYQCYGDPDYRLDRAGFADDGRRELPPFVSPREAEIELLNVRSSTRKNNDAKTVQWLKSRIEVVLQRSARTWLDDNAALQEALGDAYAEFKDFEEAIPWYARATKRIAFEDGASYPGRIYDRWLNARVRAAEARAAAGETGGEIGEIRAAATELKRLIDVHPTVERHSLVASAQKSLALAQIHRGGSSDPSAALRDCADAYFEAAALSYEVSGLYEPYPSINALITSQLAAWRDKPIERPAIDPRVLADALDTQLARAVARDAWSRVHPVDLALYVAMRDGKLDDAKTRDALIGLYTGIRRYFSPREFDSVLKQMRFVHDAAPNSRRKGAQALLDALLSIP